MALDPALDQVFDSAGKQYNVDPDLLKSIALQESGGSTARNVVSSAGAQGLMQLMPDTAKALGVTDPFDPKQAVPAAANLLARGLDQGEALAAANPAVNPVSYAVMSYFGGSDTGKWGSKTQQYVADVAGKYRGLTRGTAPGGDGGENLVAPLTIEDETPGAGTPPGSPAPPAGARTAAPGQEGASALSGVPTAGGGAAGSVFTGGLDHPPPGARPLYDLADLRQRMILAGAGGSPDLANAFRTIYENIYQNGMPYSDGRVYPVPGQQEVIRGRAEAEAEPGRVSAAVMPQTARPGEPIFYPPGSPAASLARSGAPEPAVGTAAPAQSSMYAPLSSGSAPSAGAGAPTGVTGATGTITPTAGGGMMISGAPPVQATSKFYDLFDKLQESASGARSAMFLADQLKQQLNALPSSGPLTDYFGDLDKIAEQFGVPVDVRQKFHLPSGATVAQANKLRIDLLGEILRKTFPGRITNTDIATMSPTVAGPTTPNAANNYLIDQIVRPQLQRDIDRYGSVVGLSRDDPNLVTLPQRLFEWDQNPANSFEAYRKRALASAPPPPASAEGSVPGGAAPAAPRRFRYDPASRALVPQ
ncbi:MAG TPA: transglycosylase SLT domain-containing protein [Stellaceae bacterium]|jgi:hypothetical protein